MSYWENTVVPCHTPERRDGMFIARVVRGITTEKWDHSFVRASDTTVTGKEHGVCRAIVGKRLKKGYFYYFSHSWVDSGPDDPDFIVHVVIVNIRRREKRLCVPRYPLSATHVFLRHDRRGQTIPT